MSGFLLVLPIEVALLALHTIVFIVCIRFAQKPSKTCAFFTLYSVQSLGELIAYTAVRIRNPILNRIEQQEEIVSKDLL